MPEEHSGGKPADFFVGLVDFFAILLPGAILTFWVYVCVKHTGGNLAKALPTEGEKNWVTLAAFAVAAYVAGHLLYAIGSLCLDPLYDWWKDNYPPAEWDKLKQKAAKEQSDFKMMETYLRVWSAGATAELERLEADQKFFRGLILGLLFAWPSFLWIWGGAKWAWWGLGLLLVPLLEPLLLKKSGKQKSDKEKPDKEKSDKETLELWGLWIVLIGCVLWFGWFAVMPPTAVPGVPLAQGAAQKSAPETADIPASKVASLLGLGLALSVVRFGQQRQKYSKFVYRAYLVLKLEGPPRTCPPFTEEPV
jgi:hypothetical protein